MSRRKASRRKADPREVELKLAIPEQSLAALAQHPLLRAGDGPHAVRRHAVTTYFDTADGALARQGMSLRVRAAGGRHVQTLKTRGAAGVAADRGEWEWPLPGNAPDPGLLPPLPDIAALPRPLALRPVVRTEIDRTARTLTLAGGTEVEVALDEGSIVAGERRMAVRELELELRAGDPAPLFRLAAELHAAAPFTIEAESKAARGERLRSGAAPQAHKAAEVALDPKASAAAACRQLLAAGLGHLLANQAAMRAGDAEGVHQMRVAIRRLRAILALFGPHLAPEQARRFGDALRRIGRLLGEARDWDVFCLEMLPGTLDGDGDARWRADLQAAAEPRRAAAHERLRAELAAPGFTALVLDMAAWSEGSRQEPDRLGDPALRRKLRALAPDLLDRLARKVARRGRHLGRLDQPGLHALRKSLKKLRYAIDDLRAIFPRKPVKSMLRGCKDLQRRLGELNDAATASALARSLCEGRADLAPAAEALAAEALIERLRARSAPARDALGEAWRDFRATPAFWA